jgi:hypothetical protein
MEESQDDDDDDDTDEDSTISWMLRGITDAALVTGDVTPCSLDHGTATTAVVVEPP